MWKLRKQLLNELSQEEINKSEENKDWTLNETTFHAVEEGHPKKTAPYNSILSWFPTIFCAIPSQCQMCQRDELG